MVDMSGRGLCHSTTLGRDEVEGDCAINLIEMRGGGLCHSAKLGRDQVEGDCAIRLA